MIPWPADYLQLRSSGLLQRLRDPLDRLQVWDAEFLSEEEVLAFEPMDGQIIDVVPFAMTGNGDYWCFLVEELPDSNVALCFHDSYEAEHYSSTLAGFFFKRTIEFSCFVELDDVVEGWTREYASEMLRELVGSNDGFLSDEMCRELHRIEEKTKNVPKGDQQTIISIMEGEQLIRRYVDSGHTPTAFEWRE